jgi:hypothetical protein
MRYNNFRPTTRPITIPQKGRSLISSEQTIKNKDRVNLSIQTGAAKHGKKVSLLFEWLEKSQPEMFLTITEWNKDFDTEYGPDHEEASKVFIDRVRTEFGKNNKLFKEAGIYVGKHYSFSTAISLGAVFNFIYFMCDTQSSNKNSDMINENTVPEIFSLVFTDRSNTFFGALFNGVKINVKIEVKSDTVPPPGLHYDYAEKGVDSEGKVKLPTDQTHHFAAFYQFGYNNAFNFEDVKAALWNAKDIGQPWTWDSKVVVTTRGDYELGLVGALLGKKYKTEPGYHGDEIRRTLLKPWQEFYIENKEFLSEYGFVE